jgi:hypothetical protein
LFKDLQRRPATTSGEIGRGPQNVLPITFLHIRARESEQPTGNTFQAIDHAGHRVLRWVIDEQMDVFSLAVQFDKFRLEVFANLVEHNFEPLDRVTVKHLSSTPGHEDQVNVEQGNAMSTMPNIA